MGIGMTLDTALRVPVYAFGRHRGLALARSKFTGQMAHAGQTCSQRAERNVQLCGLGLPQDFDQQCQSSLQTLDAEALRQVADRWLHRPNLSLCGPRQSLETLSRLWCSQSSRS